MSWPSIPLVTTESRHAFKLRKRDSFITLDASFDLFILVNIFAESGRIEVGVFGENPICQDMIIPRDLSLLTE